MDEKGRTIRFRHLKNANCNIERWQVIVWEKGDKRPKRFHFINITPKADGKNEICCNCADKFFRRKAGEKCYHEVEFEKYMQKLIDDGQVEAYN